MKPVVESITIEGLRGIRQGGIEGLSPLSILVGPNNSGKSTVLEAIEASSTHECREIAAFLLRRGGPTANALQWILSTGAKQLTLRLSLSETARVERTITVGGQLDLGHVTVARAEGLREPMEMVSAVTQIGRAQRLRSACLVSTQETQISSSFEDALAQTFPSAFVDVEAIRDHDALENAYSKIEEAGQREGVLRSLRPAMSKLRDLRILKTGEHFILHTISDGGPPVPAYLAGDGFKRLLRIAAAFASAQKGIVLLEEPESFQHPRYMRELTAMAVAAVKEGTQVLLSTHSIELIDLLLHDPAFENEEYPTVHRLRLVDGKLSATRLDHATALSARDDLLEDLRA